MDNSVVKPAKAIIHFNKPGSRKGLPWTVHWRGVCHIVTEVRTEVPTWTEWRPDRKKNPRAFVACLGVVRVSGGVASISER